MTPEQEKDQRILSLEASLAAVNSVLSDYALRMKQAEETTSLLLGPERSADLVRLLESHIKERSIQRAVHQQTVMQALLLSLQGALHYEDPMLRKTVITCVQQLTAALMPHRLTRLEPHPQTNTVNKIGNNPPAEE